MAERAIRLFGDALLRTEAAPVTAFDARTEQLVADLLDTVAAPGRAGLAAPQIGVGLRAFSYRCDGETGYVLNPEIVELSEELQEGPEGCLSVPDLGFSTVRAARAVVCGVDLANEQVVVHGDGELARCLQHEVDHLDGMLYLSRLEREQRREAMRQVREAEWFRGTAAPRGAS